MKLTRLARLFAAAVVTCVAACVLATPALAADSGWAVEMHRLYNPNSGEHFYTASEAERDAVIKAGWRYEGVGWYAPAKSNVPVYRLYNPNAGDHHYTTSVGEKNFLVKVGWRYEGIGWYSSEAKQLPVLRQYNPNAKAGAHNFTTSKGENNHLVSVGWRAEGIAWYGLSQYKLIYTMVIELNQQSGERTGTFWERYTLEGQELSAIPAGYVPFSGTRTVMVPTQYHGDQPQTTEYKDGLAVVVDGYAYSKYNSWSGPSGKMVVLYAVKG